MKEINLATFEEFEGRARELLEDREKKRKEKKGYFSPVLFRGQSRASWNLETTLERYSPKEYSPEDYYNIMRAVRPAVESWTEKRWPFSVHYRQEDSIPSAPQGYEFMVYLRHHGFPCPLLDWTRSFYVAAFFAFQSAKIEEPNAAIYSLIEYCGQGKTGRTDMGNIVGCGPYLRTHKRHFIQQCEYTFCKKELAGGKYIYCSHEEVVKRNDDNQDALTKFIIPKTERSKILDKLHIMNITAHSLFGSEESLLATLAYQEIERKHL
jgi:hypothetical protein